MRVIAITNQKGGCGKTTTAINLAGALQAAGQSVLLIDLDPQAHATAGLGLQSDQCDLTTYHALSLTIQPPVPLGAVIRRGSSCDIAPGHILLSTLEQELAGQEGGISRLYAGLQTLTSTYDVILIDTPPNLGFLTFNALRAAQEIIIPIEASCFSIQGVGKLQSMIDLVQTKTGHRPRLVKALMTMYDQRTKYGQRVMGEISALFGPRVYTAVIGTNVRLREAAAAGVPITQFDRRARGARDYQRLAKEVLEDRQSLDPAAFADAARALAKRVALTLQRPNAERVHVVGDFNGWRLSDSGVMRPGGDDRWGTELDLRPGRYRYKFVVDGHWMEDPNNPQQETNTFGSVDSILTVE